MDQDLKMASGVAKELSEDDKIRDDVGFTNPNLHRRIAETSPVNSFELSPREHLLSVYGDESYHTVNIITHDEDSNDSEIP